MKKITLLSLFAASMLLATACGGPAATQELTAPASTQAPTQPVATTQPAPAPGESTQVEITLADNTIQASQYTFKAGVPYTFVITNTGQRAHNFNINEPVSVKGSIEGALSGALLAVSRDQLTSGANVTVDFTFPDSAVGQQLEFSCLIKMHYEDGMRQPITVTE